MRGTPVDELTQTILYRAMSTGKVNPDLMLLLVEPLMYLIIAIAENSDIEPVIYEGEEIDEMDLNTLLPVTLVALAPGIVSV